MAKTQKQGPGAGGQGPGEKAEVVPTFVLRANGGRTHLRALMAAMQELSEAECHEAMRTLREFELYEEARR